ncbi:MAG: hypothetical protein ACNI27_09415 [Desulfovibrio sp.]
MKNISKILKQAVFCSALLGLSCFTDAPVYAQDNGTSLFPDAGISSNAVNSVDSAQLPEGIKSAVGAVLGSSTDVSTDDTALDASEDAVNTAVSYSWNSGVLSQTLPVGTPDADALDPAYQMSLEERSAVVKARKNIWAELKSMTLWSGYTVADWFAEDTEASAAVRLLLQNSSLSRMERDGQNYVTVSMATHGAVGRYIYPSKISFLSGIAPKASTGMIPNPANFTNEMSEPVVGHYTGVLIDARGLTARPALLPVVYDAEGNGVYGAFAVSREAVMTYGLAGYLLENSAAEVKYRVGGNPLIVRGLRTLGLDKTGIVVSHADGRKIQALLANGKIQERCKVMVLISPVKQVEPGVDEEELAE